MVGLLDTLSKTDDKEQGGGGILGGIMDFLRSPGALEMGAAMLRSQSPTFGGALGEGFQAFQAAQPKPLSEKDRSKTLLNQMNMMKIAEDIERHRRQENVFNQLLGISPGSSLSSGTAGGFGAGEEGGSAIGGGGGLFPNASPQQRAIAAAYASGGQTGRALEALATKYGAPIAVQDAQGQARFARFDEAGQAPQMLEGIRPMQQTKQEEQALKKYESLEKSRELYQNMGRVFNKIKDLLDQGVHTGEFFQHRTAILSGLADAAESLGMKVDDTKITNAQLLDKLLEEAFTKYFGALDKSGLTRVTQKEWEQIKAGFATTKMRPRAIRQAIDLYEREGKRQQARANLADIWVQRYGNLAARDRKGKTFEQVSNSLIDREANSGVDQLIANMG